MKRAVIFWIIASLGTQAFSGLATLCSFYMNQEEISNTFCINRFDRIPVCMGSCYLELQLDKALEDNEPRKELPVKVKPLEWMTPPSTFHGYVVQPSFFVPRLEMITGEDCFRTSIYSQSVFHPPQSRFYFS